MDLVFTGIEITCSNNIGENTENCFSCFSHTGENEDCDGVILSIRGVILSIRVEQDNKIII